MPCLVSFFSVIRADITCFFFSFFLVFFLVFFLLFLVLPTTDQIDSGGSLFFDRFVELVKEKGVYQVHRYTKTTFSKQCSNKLRKRIASECDAVVLALAD
jgi:hypothetical protein